MEIKRTKPNQDLHTRQNKLNGLSLVKFPGYLITTIISLLINLPVMNAIWRERRELETLTVEQLRDLGLDPGHVRQECRRSFFDIATDRKKLVMVIHQESFQREF